MGRPPQLWRARCPRRSAPRPLPGPCASAEAEAQTAHPPPGSGRSRAGYSRSGSCPQLRVTTAPAIVLLNHAPSCMAMRCTALKTPKYWRARPRMVHHHAWHHHAWHHHAWHHHAWAAPCPIGPSCPDPTALGRCPVFCWSGFNAGGHAAGPGVPSCFM